MWYNASKPGAVDFGNSAVGVNVYAAECRDRMKNRRQRRIARLPGIWNFMKKRLGFTTRFVVLVSVLLLAVNAALGFVLLTQSKNSLRSLINSHMIELARTASAMLDGDALGALKEEDADSQTVKNIVSTLNKIRENNSIVYIYIVRAEGDSRFVFTVDPDPEDPAAFGEEIVYTDALYMASRGEAAIDMSASEDRWGSLYSAFCPIYNSAGEISSVVGVDFSADWYNEQISRYSVTILIITGVSLIGGCLIVLLITAGFRKKYKLLSTELTDLSKDFEDLAEEIAASPGYDACLTTSSDAAAARTAAPVGDSERSSLMIEELERKVSGMQNGLRTYIEYVHALAYTDPMTGVGSRVGYIELVDRLSEKIKEGGACFAIALFDANGLKEANDNFGHEIGDAMLIDTANVLMTVFPKDRIFRIGGDEFIVVLENETLEEMQKKAETFGKMLEEYNSGLPDSALKLSSAGGAAAYDPALDVDFKSVFKRADEEMYRCKAEYYKRFGDRRKHRDETS